MTETADDISGTREGGRPAAFTARFVLDSASTAGNEVHDQRDHGEDQQQVDEAAGNVKYSEAQNPSH